MPPVPSFDYWRQHLETDFMRSPAWQIRFFMNDVISSLSWCVPPFSFLWDLSASRPFFSSGLQLAEHGHYSLYESLDLVCISFNFAKLWPKSCLIASNSLLPLVIVESAALSIPESRHPTERSNRSTLGASSGGTFEVELESLRRLPIGFH